MNLETLYLIRNKFTTEGWKQTKQTFDKHGKAISKVETQTKRYGKNYVTQTKKMSKGNATLTESYGRVSSGTAGMVKALKRAAIVAPIWLALRAVMMAVIQTIKQGAKYWMDFDKAMQKTQQVMHGISGNISDSVDSLTEKIRKLSMETGLSMAKLTATFYRFGTVGLDFETSMRGMVASTKLANVMFGDNEQIAKVLAQTYRLLGETMDSSIPVSKRMEVIGSQIYKLWKTNAFEINEFTGALERFLPTANMFNFEITDSLALLASLHTAGVKGTRAGRLLGSSMQKLVSNMSDVAQTLGVNVNPNLDSTFDMLMKTLGAVKRLTEAGRKIPDIENLTVFGGVRQRRAPMALVALFDTLLANIKSINIESGKYTDLLDDINAKNLEILDSVHKQAEKFGNLRKMTGEAFVKGVVGGENFKETLKEINSIMRTGVIPAAEVMGKSLNFIATTATKLADLFLGLTGQYKKTTWFNEDEIKKNVEQMTLLEKITESLLGKFEKPVVLDVISELKEKRDILGMSEAQIDRLASQLEKAAEKGKLVTVEMEEWRKIMTTNEAAAERFEQRVASIREEIKRGDLSEGLVGIKDPKTGKELFVYSNKLLEKNRENFKSQVMIRGKIKEQLGLLEKQEAYVRLLNQGYLKSEISMSKLTDYISEQVRIYNATQSVVDGTVESIKKETVLSAVLDKNYEKVLDIFNQTGIQQEKLLQMEKKRLDVVKDRIKEERKNVTLSSETLKLYKIAQKYGAEPARRISEFLRGKMDYQAFKSRDSFDIFKEEFAQLEEQYRASEYLKRGAGRGISIKEKALRIPESQRKRNLMQEERLQIPEVPTVSAKIDFKTTIEKIQVNLPEGTQGELADSIGKDIIESLKNNEDMAKILAKTIRPFI